MEPFYVLNLQSTLTLVAFSLIAKWHIAPRLAHLPLEASLIPLIWIHVFRYAPMTLFAPGQSDPLLPQDVVSSIAYGDLVSGILALVAVVFLKYKIAGAIAVVWAFSIVGLGDVVLAMARGIGAELFKHWVGFSWYIITFYVPVLTVTHIMIIYRLLKKK